MHPVQPTDPVRSGPDAGNQLLCGNAAIADARSSAPGTARLSRERPLMMRLSPYLAGLGLLGVSIVPLMAGEPAPLPETRLVVAQETSAIPPRAGVRPCLVAMPFAVSAASPTPNGGTTPPVNGVVQS